MDTEEKEYLETRGGEVPKKEEAVKPEETPVVDVPVEAAIEEAAVEEVPSLEKPGLAVPYNRFKEVNSKLKEYKEREPELMTKLARLEGELNALKAPKPEVPKVEEKPVDWDQDPKKYTEQVNNRQQELVRRLEAQERETKMREAKEAFMNAYRGKVSEYTKSNPDFQDAYNYLFDNRLQELQAAGFDYQTAHQRTLADEEMMVWNAMQTGKNPGEVLHNVAKTRGYKAKANGEDKLKTVEAAKKVSSTIAGSGGNTVAGAPSLEALADMESDDFNKVMANEKARAKFWAKHGG